jgi:hypothetical protein
MKSTILATAAVLALTATGVTGALAQHHGGGVGHTGGVRGGFAPGMARGGFAPSAGFRAGAPHGFAANGFRDNRFVLSGRRRYWTGGWGGWGGGLYAYAGSNCTSPYGYSSYDYDYCSYGYGPGYDWGYGSGWGW